MDILVSNDYEQSTFQNLANKPADDIHEFLENVSIIVSISFLRLMYGIKLQNF